MMPARLDRFLRTYMARQPRRGPVMLMGLIWFGVLLVVALLASLSGPTILAVFFGLLGALGALQASVAWAGARSPINQFLAAFIALALPLLALLGNRMLGVGIVVMVLGALVLGADAKPSAAHLKTESLTANLTVAGATLRVAFPLGMLGASLVQLQRISWMSLALLLGVVCVYDAGHYLIGSTVNSRWAGIGAGLAGNIVVMLVAAALNPHPFEADTAARLVTALAALSCPLGQWLGSFMLPNALSKAPALRRIDAWLIAGPLFWAAAAIGS